MLQLNNEILLQFAHKGLSINEGIAIDGRLVKSASRPINNTDIKKRKEKKDTPEGDVDEHGNALKPPKSFRGIWDRIGPSKTIPYTMD